LKVSFRPATARALLALPLLHLLDHLQQGFLGIGPVVALEAAKIVDHRPTPEALQAGDGPRCLGVDELLFAQDDAGDHLAAAHLTEGGRHDVEPVGLALAIGAALAVATYPEWRANGLIRHAE